MNMMHIYVYIYIHIHLHMRIHLYLNVQARSSTTWGVNGLSWMGRKEEFGGMEWRIHINLLSVRSCLWKVVHILTVLAPILENQELLDMDYE